MVYKFKLVFYIALSSRIDYFVTEYTFDSIFELLFALNNDLHQDYKDCFKFEVLKIYEK